MAGPRTDEAVTAALADCITLLLLSLGAGGPMPLPKSQVIFAPLQDFTNALAGHGESVRYLRHIDAHRIGFCHSFIPCRYANHPSIPSVYRPGSGPQETSYYGGSAVSSSRGCLSR